MSSVIKCPKCESRMIRSALVENVAICSNRECGFACNANEAKRKRKQEIKRIKAIENKAKETTRLIMNPNLILSQNRNSHGS